MSILTRPLLRAAQRFDLEDWEVLLSALRTDSNFYTKRLLSSQNYILQGFTISQSFIGQSSADLTMANATLINGAANGDASWWTAPASAVPQAIPVGSGGIQPGRNYIEVKIVEQDGTPLQRAFWDPSANSGLGVEFTNEVDTVTELFIQIVVNQTGFTIGDGDYIPVAIMDVDGLGLIKGVQDRRNLFFRLGKPEDVEAGYNWGSKTEPTTILTFSSPSGVPFVSGETVSFTSGATAEVVIGGTNNIEVMVFSSANFLPGNTVTGGTSGANAVLQSYYQKMVGADKDIKNYRDLFAAYMNEIRNIKGTRFWFEDGGVASLPSLMDYVNAIITPKSDGASWSWTGSALAISDNMTSGQSTADVLMAIRIPGSNQDLLLTRQDGTGGSATLTIPDQNILYVELPNSGNRTFSEAGAGVTNYRVIHRNSFVPTDKNFVIAIREGTQLVIRGTGELSAGESIQVGDELTRQTLAFIGAESETDETPPYTSTPSGDLSNQFDSSDSLTQAISINAANINDMVYELLRPYQEKMTVVSGAPANDNEITGPVTIGTTITIPLDSRRSNAQKYYKAHSGSLIIFLNGQELIYGEDYFELGISGSLQTDFQINQDLVVGDVLDFRLVNPQVFGTAGLPQPWFVNYIIGQNGSQIPSGSLYNFGDDKLAVWRNGLFMTNSNTIGDPIDRYTEANNNSISIYQVANPTEIFTFANHENIPSVTIITGITGTVITVPTYVMGSERLRVFRNGVLLTKQAGAPVDLFYSETSTTSITLSLAVAVTDVLVIWNDGVAPTFRETQTGLTGSVVTTANALNAPNNKHLVFRNGVLIYDSIVLGDPADRYQITGANQITVGAALVATDVIEIIRVP